MHQFYDSIVVPVSFDEKTSIIIHQASIFARLFNCDTTLLHVYVPQTDPNKLSFDKVQNDLSYLAEQSANKFDNTFYSHLIVSQNIAKAIIEFSAEHDARLIIMGDTSSTNAKLIGKTTELVIRLSRCPVLTIRKKIIYEIEKILLPIDISKPSKHKLSWAIYFSKMFGCILKIIYISSAFLHENIEQNQSKMHQIKTFLNNNNVFCTTEILKRNSILESEADIILNYAQKHSCDMIMIMTRQESKNTSIIGRTADKIISLSDIPVITITPISKNIFFETENIYLP